MTADLVALALRIGWFCRRCFYPIASSPGALCRFVRRLPPGESRAMSVHHDDPLVEEAARALCLSLGGNCIGGVSCGRPSRCRTEGWLSWVAEVETVLRVIRRQHLIQPKQRAASSVRARAATPTGETQK